MNLGILIYTNTWLPGKSSNIGDYVQTLAQINLYRKIVSEYYDEDISFEVFFESVMSGWYCDFKFIFIPRDNLSQTASKYPNEKIYVIMNGWYMHECNEERELDWPPPDNIIPWFISFHVADKRMFYNEYLDYWRKHQPIGCRDMATMEKFKRRGIDAYFTGCLTLTIDFFEWNPSVKRTAVIDVNVNPKTASYKFDMFRHMICKGWTYMESLRFAYDLLKKYSKYERVITSRLHAYLPCTSMGVPSEFVSPQGSTREKTWGSPDRFDGIRGLSRSDILKIRKNIYDKMGVFRSFISKEDEKLIKLIKNTEKKKEISPESFNVVFASDEKFLKLIPNVVRSIHTHNSKHKVTFHLLYNGQRSFLPFLDEVFAKFPNFELRVYDKDLSTAKYSNVLFHVSSATMLRLYIASVLENLNGKVLYLDLDVVVNMDLKKIFELEVPKTGIVAKKSRLRGLMKEWLERSNVETTYAPGHSFNAGVMLMDLDLMRTNDYTEKLMELWDKYPTCNDQILLNLYCNGNYGQLPPHYNLFNYQDDGLMEQHDDFILHYVGSRKPWTVGECRNKRVWRLYDESKISLL